MSMGVLAPGMRCISSSNRNFPGRMGDGGRVHLAAPAVVAASAILGRIGSVSDLLRRDEENAGAAQRELAVTA
jgi:homoaconitase/3-isopropylmalate dehydratase large subunit